MSIAKYWVTCADDAGCVVMNYEKEGDYEAIEFFAKQALPEKYHQNLSITIIDDSGGKTWEPEDSYAIERAERNFGA